MLKFALVAGTVLATVAVLNFHVDAILPPTSVDLLLKANDRVQAAIDSDFCQSDESSTTRGDTLSANNRAVYDRIMSALDKEFAATNGTDSAVEAIADNFCDAVSNR
jgi:hypothetical protein